jgi:hypothetical protein
MELMIPKTEHLDAAFSEKLISFFVFGPLIRKAVSAAIEFHGKLGDGAVEIEKVNAASILAAEFEFGEAAVAQQTPQAFFSISGFFSQMAGEVAGGNSPGSVLAVFQ